MKTERLQKDFSPVHFQPSKRMLEEFLEELKLQISDKGSTQMFVYAGHRRLQSCEYLVPEPRHILHTFCRRKAVKFNARVHPAQQRMSMGEEYNRRERCYFPASNNPHGGDCLRGVRTSFDLRDSGKNEDLTNGSPNVLSSWQLPVLLITVFCQFGMH